MSPVLENVKIAVLPSCSHFVGLELKVSRAKRKLVSSCLGIIYLAPGEILVSESIEVMVKEKHG